MPPPKINSIGHSVTFIITTDYGYIRVKVSLLWHVATARASASAHRIIPQWRDHTSSTAAELGYLSAVKLSSAGPKWKPRVPVDSRLCNQRSLLAA